jgi:endoglucanase
MIKGKYQCRKFFRLAALLFAALLGAAPDFAWPAQPGAHAGFVTARGRELIAPNRGSLLLKGINLGNWLVPEGYMFTFSKARAPWQIQQIIKELVGTEANNAFWQQWHSSFITREDIRYIRSTGLNMVRVPFDYRLFTPEDYPGTWTKLGFDLLDKVVEWSAKAGLYVLLDMHAAPCGQTGANIDNSYGYPGLYGDPACRSRTAEIWRRIAAHYADNRHVIGYDLLNEPIPKDEEYSRLNYQLEPVYKEIAAAIRRVDKNHLLFLSGAQWGGNFAVFNDVNFDSKLVYTFHVYRTEPREQVLAQYLQFAKRYNVPIFLGESGENTDEWVRDFRRALELNDIGWAFWTYKRLDATASMRTYDRPPYWEELVSYQARFEAPFSDRKKVRPSVEHSLAALNGLLRNARLEKTRVNAGYVKALGMTP